MEVSTYTINNPTLLRLFSPDATRVLGSDASTYATLIVNWAAGADPELQEQTLHPNPSPKSALVELPFVNCEAQSMKSALKFSLPDIPTIHRY